MLACEPRHGRSSEDLDVKDFQHQPDVFEGLPHGSPFILPTLLPALTVGPECAITNSIPTTP